MKMVLGGVMKYVNGGVGAFIHLLVLYWMMGIFFPHQLIGEFFYSVGWEVFYITLKRWRKGQTVESWEAHKSAIQAVIKLPSGELVLGSTDTTLKLWRGKTCLHTLPGIPVPFYPTFVMLYSYLIDTVRGLAVMHGLGILSASNDGSIMLWAQSGEVLMVMVGHSSIVYSVDSHVSGLIVSGSEDRFAKIWKDGVCMQSLEHPGCVWDAKFLENGDIVTACSDGVTRIWTVDQGNVADPVELEAYTSELSEYKLSSSSNFMIYYAVDCLLDHSGVPKKSVGGLKLVDLPGVEALQIPGMKAILKDGCLAAINERPVDFADDNKWNEMDGNAMANFHLALADEVLSSIEERRQLRRYGIISPNCTRPHREQERAELLLQSLPDSYDQLIINLTNSNVTSLVFDDVAAAVLQEENRRKNKEDKQVILQQAEALTTTRGRSTERGQSSSHKHGRSKSRSKKNLKCYHCGKKAHLKKDCWSLNKNSNPQGNTANTSDDGDALCCEASTTVEGRKRFADIWLIDSGATYHMTSRREWFHHYEPVSGGSVYSCNDHALDIVGVGTIKLKMYDGTIKVVRDVRHVKGLKKNLLSYGLLDNNASKIETQKGIMKVFRGALVVLKGEKIAANLYMLKGETLLEAEASVASCSSDSAMLWHKKLGHMSEQGMKVLVEQKLLPSLTKVSLPLCEHCITSKQHRLKFNTSNSRGKSVLELVHSDVWQAPVTSLGRAKYFVSFIDDYSRRCWVYPIKKKADEQNLVRKNTSNVEGCMPRKSFWAEAVNTACYLVNRAPSTAIELKTPMEMWTGKPTDYSNLHVFGSIVYVMYNSQEISKLDPKSRKCKFLGYADGVKGYRLWDPTARKVIISRDVIFVKDKLQRKEDDASAEKSEITHIHVEKEVEQGDSSEAEPAHDEQELESSEAPITRQSDRVRRRPNWHSDYVIEGNIAYCLLTEDGRKPIGNKWVFKIKRNVDDQVERYRARLVVKGYAQKEEQLDVKTAFLHGNLEEEIYMLQPEGFEEKEKKNLVCMLNKSLYGLKQAPRCWYKRFDSFIMCLGYNRLNADPCAYFKRSGDNDFVILLLYVDDILVAGPNKDHIEELKAQLVREFEMKDLGSANKILGMQIHRDRSNRKIWLSQKNYLKKILSRFRMQDCKPISTPLPINFKLSSSMSPSSEEERMEISRVPYASAVGSLMFAMICTRPDIAQAVGVVSRYMANPGKEHWNTSVVATSTTEAEYVAATQASKEAIWLKMLLEELGHNQEYVSLFCDSQSALHLARNPAFHSRTKHIRVQYHFIREKVEEGTVDMQKIHTKDNIADFMTKAINADKFTWCRSSCGLSETPICSLDSGRGEARGQAVALTLQMIGEVVDGPDDSMNRTVLDGVQYDYVFDVDIGDGEPIRKLPYNRSGPTLSFLMIKFMIENLPLSYRQQIVEFILQNTGQKDFNIDPTFRDPYTGGDGREEGSKLLGSGAVKTFGHAASAYVPGQPSNTSGISAKPTFKHIPKRGMLVFDAAQFDGILKKISEFNNTLLADSEKKDLSLTEPKISRLGAIVKILKDTSHYHSSTFADVDIALLLKLLKSLPLAMIFPAIVFLKCFKFIISPFQWLASISAVIDILRMIVLHPDGATVLLRHVEVNDVVMEMIMKVTTEPAVPANFLTSIRAILDAFLSCLASPNKNLQLAYSTLILNYAVLLIEKKDEEGQSHVLSAALENSIMLVAVDYTDSLFNDYFSHVNPELYSLYCHLAQIAEQENLEVDSRFRALVAIGSLVLSSISNFLPSAWLF
ncbi:cytochrome c bioproteinsis protein CCS1 [Hibiscus syriacus]|uniref:Cytochrome c bioproteinsis protein CCS1 n=1 Tax=Hibiscus syriacus TaxID=106335 RepID=A0A6A2Z6N9_HIBSY|nr:cytochrome c bioproteinsis protein CCS1 [Hibiscus syriacus]